MTTRTSKSAVKTSPKRAARKKSSKGQTPKRGTRKPKVASEATLWASLDTTATGAFDFWNTFIGLLMGTSNDTPLTPAAITNFRTIIRAVSWVESKHGTAGSAGNYPSRDPMQCGNPADTWWQTLVGDFPQTERFIRGPGLSNYWVEELPAAAGADANFPSGAGLSNLGDQTKGHNDSNFTSTISFYWGGPFLIQKINKIPSGATYKCDNASKTRMVDGAVAYNGGGDPQGPDHYRQMILDAWDLIVGLTRKKGKN